MTEKYRNISDNRFIRLLDGFYTHSEWTLRKPQERLLANKLKVALVFSAIAELDTYLSLAEYGLEHPDDMLLPEILSQSHPQLSMTAAHNPFVYFQSAEKSIPNDLHLSGTSDSPHFAILTGPNAGGKSTFLKMIAMSSIQAQIGAPVPAKAFVFTPMEVMTNIDISDSLERGKSFFRAESKRISDILAKLDKEPKLLVIMDEILLGTNPEDRSAMEQELIRYMANSKRLALLATHDIQVTHLAKEVEGIQNLQVEETRNANGKFNFTFKIIPGVSQSTTAFEVLKAEGVSDDIIMNAMKVRYGADYEKMRQNLGFNSP